MSSFVSARNAAENGRRPSTTSGAKLRGPSVRVGTRERRPSSGEVIPEDSASNAPPRRNVSDIQPVNGSSKTANERQTGKIHLGTRDGLYVRTTSPVKISAGDRIGYKSSWVQSTVQLSNQSAQRPASTLKERKNIRKLDGRSAIKWC